MTKKRGAMSANSQQIVNTREQLVEDYLACRRHSVVICEPLTAEDSCIQTMPDVSPPKWHLAHTSWFFETFLLTPNVSNYQCFHPKFDYLFNSYYVTHSQPYPRPQRGLLSRPTYEEVLRYRAYVDEAMQQLLMTADGNTWRGMVELVVLGINHEQQHQELLYTDIKHIFSQNPLQPAYRHNLSVSGASICDVEVDLQWHRFKAGITHIGHDADTFAFDNEDPPHDVLIQDFCIANRLVTNREYLAFIEDDGYQRPEFWMSEGWATLQQQQWYAPLYWELHSTGWQVFGLHGLQALELGVPVCHLSFYEADAYARWCGKRLPTEFEWEHVAKHYAVNGNCRESGALKPVATINQSDITQLYGDVWEWTASPYTAYPGYRPASGSIGEYNGKFMSNQMVLRGGSCVTPQQHIRASYRNSFYPSDRWQFSGIRLADNA